MEEVASEGESLGNHPLGACIDSDTAADEKRRYDSLSRKFAPMHRSHVCGSRPETRIPEP